MNSQRRIFYSSKKINGDNSMEYELSYLILVNELYVLNTCLEGYGISIRMESGNGQKEKSIPNITLFSSEIETLIEKISRGIVLPDDLEDVLDSLMV